VTPAPAEYTRRSAGKIDAQMQAVDDAVYNLDIDQVAALDPNLVVRQATCDVCAVDASQVPVTRIGPDPDVLTLDSHSFSHALADIGRVRRADTAGQIKMNR
jgi:iron complex transport system substrate-binding protein